MKTMARIDHRIEELLKARRRLSADQGRIARRNSRRALFAALRSIRIALDQDYPAVEKPAPRTRVERAAEVMNWRKFQYDVIKYVHRPWNREFATRFLSYAAGRLGVPEKPIVFDLKGVLGMHTPDQIRLNPDLSREDRWRLLFHEIAHYRAKRHDRAFVRELAHVYRLWREFLAAEREHTLTEQLSHHATEDPSNQCQDQKPRHHAPQHLTHKRNEMEAGDQQRHDHDQHHQPGNEIELIVQD
jgi:hypothetical protein